MNDRKKIESRHEFALFPLYLRLPSCRILLLRSSLLHTPYIRLRAMFMLHRIQVFHSPKHDTLDVKVCRNAFWSKYDYHCTGKEYFKIKDETKQTEIKTHIYQNPSIIVERFHVSYFYDTAHTQTTHCSRSCTDSMDFGKRRFYRNL